MTLSLTARAAITGASFLSSQLVTLGTKSLCSPVKKSENSQTIDNKIQKFIHRLTPLVTLAPLILTAPTMMKGIILGAGVGMMTSALSKAHLMYQSIKEKEASESKDRPLSQPKTLEQSEPEKPQETISDTKQDTEKNASIIYNNCTFTATYAPHIHHSVDNSHINNSKNNSRGDTNTNTNTTTTTRGDTHTTNTTRGDTNTSYTPNIGTDFPTQDTIPSVTAIPVDTPPDTPHNIDHGNISAIATPMATAPIAESDMPVEQNTTEHSTEYSTEDLISSEQDPARETPDASIREDQQRHARARQVGWNIATGTAQLAGHAAIGAGRAALWTAGTLIGAGYRRIAPQQIEEGDPICVPEVSRTRNIKGSHNVTFENHRIYFPFRTNGTNSTETGNITEFAERATDQDILNLWDAIEKTLPDVEILEEKGAHLYFKTDNTGFHVDVRVPIETDDFDGRRRDENGDLIPSHGSPLYEKSKIENKNNIKDEADWTEHQDGFVQFQALNPRTRKVRSEDLICPAANHNIPPIHHEDLAKFLRHRPIEEDKEQWEKEKISFFRRFAAAIERTAERVQSKDPNKENSEVYFHIGRLRSEPYLHAHIVHPNRSYLRRG